MEGMTGACTTSTYPYAVKHDPFAYYGGRCPSNVVPFTHFAGDMKGTVPRFVWITPDMCHDGHDCSTATADAWLSKTVPVILNSTAWKQGGVLFVTWDEGEDQSHRLQPLQPAGHDRGGVRIEAPRRGRYRRADVGPDGDQLTSA